LIAQRSASGPTRANWKWEVQVHQRPEDRERLLHGGRQMAIYTGLLEQLKPTDDEVAQVMGHEIAHCARQTNTQERMSIAMTSQVGLELAAFALGGRQGGDLGLTGAQLAAVLRDTAAEQPRERERSRPDRHRARRPRRLRPQCPRSRSGKRWKRPEAKEPPQFLSTHPSPENRRQRLAELGPQMERRLPGSEGASGRQRAYVPPLKR